MNKVLTIATFSLVAIFCAAAGEAKIHGKLDGQLVATGTGKIMIIGTDGKTLWQHKAGNCHDVWMLPNGNILYADRAAVEINPKTNKVVFQYKCKSFPREGVYACQRLADGKTLIGENGTGKVLEVDKDGKVTFELQLPDTKNNAHHNFRMVRKLDNGNYLVCFSGKKVVREYTPDGKKVLELKASSIAFSAVRLPNGNTMMGHIGLITEFDPKGKKVWEFNAKKDAKGIKIGKMCGMHILDNGNIVIGVYGSAKGQNALFEINRKKEIVWRYCGKDKHMMNAQKLTADGKVLSKKTLH